MNCRFILCRCNVVLRQEYSRFFAIQFRIVFAFLSSRILFTSFISAFLKQDVYTELTYFEFCVLWNHNVIPFHAIWSTSKWHLAGAVSHLGNAVDATASQETSYFLEQLWHVSTTHWTSGSFICQLTWGAHVSKSVLCSSMDFWIEVEVSRSTQLGVSMQSLQLCKKLKLRWMQNCHVYNRWRLWAVHIVALDSNKVKPMPSRCNSLPLLPKPLPKNSPTKFQN